MYKNISLKTLSRLILFVTLLTMSAIEMRAQIASIFSPISVTVHITPQATGTPVISVDRSEQVGMDINIAEHPNPWPMFLGKNVTQVNWMLAIPPVTPTTFWAPFTQTLMATMPAQVMGIGLMGQGITPFTARILVTQAPATVTYFEFNNTALTGSDLRRILLDRRVEGVNFPYGTRVEHIDAILLDHAELKQIEVSTFTGSPFDKAQLATRLAKSRIETVIDTLDALLPKHWVALIKAEKHLVLPAHRAKQIKTTLTPAEQMYLHIKDVKVSPEDARARPVVIL